MKSVRLSTRRLLRVCGGMLAVGALLLGGSVAASTPAMAAPGDVVDIPDANLRACINTTKLGQAAEAAVTEAQMATLGGYYATLSCDEQNIRSLEGLQYATGLRALSLSENPVSDLSPLAGLGQLKLLYLEGTGARDLTQLSGVTSLETLLLRRNGISSLQGLETLVNLTSLHLDENEIADISPLAGMTKMRSLSFSENNVSDLTPMAGMSDLARFEGRNNTITSLVPLSGKQKLRVIWLQQNQISDISPLAGLTTLQEIRLDSNQVSDLAPLTGLTAEGLLLFFSGNKISEVPANLTEMFPTLRVLGLSLNRITDLTPFAALPPTVALSLANNGIRDISTLAGNQGYAVLDLSANRLTDLSPLAGRHFGSLNLTNTHIKDLSPLATSTFNRFEAENNGLKDISALADNTIDYLFLKNNNIEDISALASVQFQNAWVYLSRNNITDISALADGHFNNLWLHENSITDISPLHGKTVSGQLYLAWQTVQLPPATVGASVLNPVRSEEGRPIALTLDSGSVNPCNVDCSELVYPAEGTDVKAAWTHTLPSSGNAAITRFSGEIVRDVVAAEPIGEAPTLEGVPSDGRVDTAYAYAFAVTGDPEPTVALASGELPPGLTISAEGVLSGTPTTAGEYSFVLEASNGVGAPASLLVEMNVAAADAGPAVTLGNPVVSYEMGGSRPSSTSDWVDLFAATATGTALQPLEVDATAVDFGVPHPGGYEVSFTVRDVNDETFTAVGRYVVEDTTAPVLTAERDSVKHVMRAPDVEWDTQEWLDQFGITATDTDGTGVDPDAWEVVQSVDFTSAGEHRVAFSVRDVAGNESAVLEVTLVVQAPPTSASIVMDVAQDQGVHLDPLSRSSSEGTLQDLVPENLGVPSQGGTLVLSDGGVLYTPAAGFHGEETAIITVSDDLGQTAELDYVFTVVEKGALDGEQVPGYSVPVDGSVAIPEGDVLRAVTGSGLEIEGYSTPDGFVGTVTEEGTGLRFVTDGSEWEGSQSFMVSVADRVGQTVEVPVQIRVEAPTFTSAQSRVQAGGEVSVESAGLVPGKEYTVELHSTPVRVASFTADADGTARLRVVIPANTVGGEHRLVLLNEAQQLRGVQQLQVQTASSDSPRTGLAATGGSGAVAALAVLAGIAILGGAVVLYRSRRRAASRR